MKIKPVLTLLTALSLTSCGLWGPNYVKPNVDTPEQWRSKDKLSKADNDSNFKNEAWWLRFNDPKLDFLMYQALLHNNTIQQSIGNIIQAQANLEAIEYGWVPTLSLSPSYSTSAAFANNLNSQTSSATVGGNTGYTVGLIPNYTINILQQLRSEEFAKSSLLQATYTKNATRLAVLSQVAGGYFTLVQQTYLLQLQKDLTNDTLAAYKLAQDQYDNGYISLLTLQSYLQYYQTAKAQQPIIENNIIQSQNAIQVLINRNPGPIVNGVKFNEVKTDGIIPANLPSVVLQQRPDVMAAEEQLKAANANIGVATSTFFPSINLTGGVGSATSSLSSLFAPTDSFWQVRAAATFPFNLAAVAKIKGAKGAYYSAYYNYINTVRTAFQQVDNGLSAHQKITENYQEQLKFYASNKTTYDLSVASFNNGLYNKLQELNAKVQLDNAAITVANSKMQQLQSIVNLYQALAGGYNIKNTESAYSFADARDAN
ncbi:MAG: efflux transporter outer membrane subunit [Burkholderiales bacterium]|nr:efflux transporter outer membrane subunit [Burkholderiales bacterium]